MTSTEIHETAISVLRLIERAKERVYTLENWDKSHVLYGIKVLQVPTSKAALQRLKNHYNELISQLKTI